MAGLNFANELENLEYSYSTDVMTGGSDKKMYLYYQLISSLKRADSVDFLVDVQSSKFITEKKKSMPTRSCRRCMNVLSGKYVSEGQ